MASDPSICFVSVRNEPIRQLRGFEKHHRVPTPGNAGDLKFLYSLVEPTLDDDLQQTFSALRKAFGLKRKEIQVDGPYDGMGLIRLPFFEYRVSAGFNPEEPSQVDFQRRIENISEPARILAPPFADAINYHFARLELSLEEPLDLEAVVDSMEESMEDEALDKLQLDYDKDVTWCELLLMESLTTVRLESNLIKVYRAREATAPELLEAFASVQHFISNLDLLRFS